MKEIKLRVWNNKLNIWESNFLISQTGVIGIFRMVDPKVRGIVWEKLSPLNYIIQQYTGLLDKNGKEIYEGDIIKRGTEIVPVHYKNACFFAGRILLIFWHRYSEVVGNIFENKDLLK